MRKIHFLAAWPLLLIFSTSAIAVTNPYDYSIPMLSVPTVAFQSTSRLSFLDTIQPVRIVSVSSAQQDSNFASTKQGTYSLNNSDTNFLPNITQPIPPPTSIYRHPTFIAGVTTLVAGGIMLIIASVLQARQGTPGTCLIRFNGQTVEDPNCSYGPRPIFDSAPAPAILFSVGGVSVLAGAGLLIYWGVKVKKNHP